MSEGSAQEHARSAEEARREAHDAGARAKERAKSRASRAKAEVLTGETAEETVRQVRLIYGGLIGIAVVMAQPFLAAASLDLSAKVSVIAFSVAIPLLVGVLVHSAGYARLEGLDRLARPEP
jgi:hypothetical protein